jgi:PAS domain S-box-containing protein
MSRPEIERLVQRLAETEEELRALLSDEVDAIVNPASATPILLGGAQRALAESEARYRELVTRCPALVCELLPHGSIAFANDAFRSLLGFEPSTLIGESLWAALAADGHEDAARCFHSLLQRGDVANHELLLRSAAGEPRWILWTTANRYDVDGSLDRAVAFGIDITARKQAEEAALQLREAENARVRAEAANKAKTEFLAVMSHELRTPLNAISGYAELIELGVHGPVTDEQRRALQRIRSSQRHLLGLINDLMNFARLETGQVRVAARDVAVNEILAVVDALTAPQLASKGLRYEVGRCDATLTTFADKDRVEQILINLVSNASKFTPEGGRVALGCDADHSRVRFHVTDTGVGIPPEKLGEIFEPFVQVRTGFTRPHDGVGLGLAISRDLARKMHGDLEVESREGQGSRFTLSLPRHDHAGSH